MKINRFEDIIAWQKSEELALLVYKLFGKQKDYNFRDQITRAVISIMNNIAEGFERRTNKDFTHFLYISKGSCAEVRSMAHLAKKLGYISDKEYCLLYESTIEISKMLSGFIKTL